ncbi:MAG: ABC transporter ATP-binding protein [Microbacteriaceae bacterium]|nr:ABC transporter ATP-binding protein [Microbacteriaceae bacterium]
MSNTNENNPRSREYKGPRASFKQLIPYIAAEKTPVIIAMVLSIIGAGLSLAQPLMVGNVISAVEQQQEILPFATILVVLILLSAGFSGFQYFLLAKTGEAVVLNTRKQLISKLLRLPIYEYDQRRVGDMVSRAGSDSTLLRAVLTQGLVEAVGGAFLFLGALIAMAVIDLPLLLATLAVLAFSIIGISIAGRRIRFATTQAQQRVGEMSSSVERALSAIRTIRAARAEKREGEAIYKEATEAYDQGVKIASLSAIVAPIAQLSLNIAFIVVIGAGGLRVASGETDIASLVTFVILLFFLVGPLLQAFGAYSSVMSALGALARIQEIMALPDEQLDDAPSTRSPKNDTAVEFRNVGFQYAGDESKPVLTGINFKIERGQRVALVGPSGAGKSTTFSLIERFYEPSEGQILMDGQAVTEFSRATLREQIGYVEQDAPVLAGSLKDNLLLGKEFADDSELIRVLERVNLTEVLNRDSRGLDAQVGEDGIMLSGGEKQRLAIARALLSTPPILLLDESTSSLDGLNEQRMREAIDAVSENRTMLVIAHRLSTVVDSDLIIVLENGKIIGQGTHSELLESTPLYQDLAKHQLLV